MTSHTELAMTFARSALKEQAARIAELEEALRNVIQATHSHIDGRDLLAELHPRNMLDIKRRIDARETWFQGDWLSDLWREVKAARSVLNKETNRG